MKTNKPRITPNIESEVKFLLNAVHRLEENLQKAGGEMQHTRVLETNLRFDTPNGSLSSNNQVLRLRKDQQVRFNLQRVQQILTPILRNAKSSKSP